MLIDARHVPTGERLSTTVCIVGGGPAGLYLADALSRRGIDSILVERGGLPGAPLGVGESETHTSADSDFDAPPSIPPRLAGGSNEWIVRLPWMKRGVRMVPLSPIDVETHDWIPNSGWPIRWEDLSPYFERAHNELGLGRWVYDPQDWEDSHTRRWPTEATGFRTSIERFQLSSWISKALTQRVCDDPHVRVLTYAKVGSIEGSPTRAHHVQIDCGTNARFEVEARTFVLASGGVENPRLLLTAHDCAGIGERSPALGCYFMDHLRLMSGILTPFDRRRFDDSGIYGVRDTPNGFGMGKLVPTDELLRSHGLLHSSAQMLPLPSAEIQAAMGSGPRGVRDVARAVAYVLGTAPAMAVRQRRIPPRTDAGWSATKVNHLRYSSFTVEHQVEQAPVAENGFTLGGIDHSGRRTTDLRWRWSEIDLRSVRLTQRLFASSLAAAGIGTFTPTEWEEHPALTTPGGSFHPSGATRMHRSSQYGVVDADPRVHGTDNVYVAGSSVFPTSGYVNPTLTIIALAIRLGDHLASTTGQVPIG